MTVAVRGRALRALLALPLLAFAASVQASGFAIESQGSRAMGFAGAYVAQAADPSAIFYNAAGIGFLKGQQLYISGAFAGLSTDFTGEGPYPAAGTLEKSSRGLGILPAFYYSQQVVQKLAVGLGVSRPFANRSEWQNPDDFTGRFICLECQFASWSIISTIAFRLADRFSIGAGDDVRLSSFKLSRRLVDPGFGFGKSVQHNFTLLRELAALQSLGCPVIWQDFRASMLGAVTGRTVDHRLAASVAAALLAVDRGARIVRVHDVAATRDALQIWAATREGGKA